jgi:tRNA dimethylallyltransferase
MKEMGNKAFHEMLAARDPEMAGRLHVNDSQRLQRAYEVLEDTGKSLAYWQSLPKETPPDYFDFEIRKIIPEKKALKSNIDRRFDIMLEQGALEEVGELMDRIHRGAVPADAPVTGALGYQHLASCLRGEIPVEEACWLAKTQTRQYAKRQITWLRNQLKTS